jgi:rSAM/selenodomain-associated transferase 1
VKKGGPLAVVFFVKYPEPGKVKTRLAAEIGAKKAAEIHAALAEVSYGELKKCPYDIIICFSPARKIVEMRKWLKGANAYISQKGNGLGERMSRAFKDCFAAGYSRVVLTGSDIPELNRKVIGDAFEKLRNNEAVVGPASDGGYYLIGFTAGSFKEDVFMGMNWSTLEVLDLTIKKLDGLKIGFSMVKILNDVDRKEDLKNAVISKLGVKFL